MDSIFDITERGPLYWHIKYAGIHGGTIVALICKNRISFIKYFPFKTNEDFETAKKICQNKVSALLHLKNGLNPTLKRLSNYRIDATVVEEKEF